MNDYQVVMVPREGVNDDVVRVLEWLAGEGEKVEAGAAIVILETAKTTFEVAAPAAGFLFHLGARGAEVPVGAPLALLSEGPRRPDYQVNRPAPERAGAADQVVTQKARALIESHGLCLDSFAGLAVVRSADVEKVLREKERPAEAARPRFRGVELDPNADWDTADAALLGEVKALLLALRKGTRARFNRHVPTGTLLHDRWELAKDAGFGDGTSVYDECLILGDVKVGRHCWIGPYTIIDGLHAELTIGDYVDIGAGTHVYTHNTIERALTGHQAPLFKKPTKIGNCCFIAPQVVIAPGTVIGDHCFVAAGSYVEGTFPAYSYIAGNPATVVGVVAVEGGRAKPRLSSHPCPPE